MQDLVFLVSLLFLAVLVTGPLSVWLAVRQFFLASLIVAATALMFGIYWFGNVTTPIRFLGLLTAVLGVTAIWYSMRLSRW